MDGWFHLSMTADDQGRLQVVSVNDCPLAPAVNLTDWCMLAGLPWVGMVPPSYP